MNTGLHVPLKTFIRSGSKYPFPLYSFSTFEKPEPETPKANMKEGG